MYFYSQSYKVISKLVHYDTGVEDDYLPQETFFSRVKRMRKVECGKNHLTHEFHTVFYSLCARWMRHF